MGTDDKISTCGCPHTTIPKTESTGSLDLIYNYAGT
jgi:hypothetical protein